MSKKIVFITPPSSLEEAYGGLSKVASVSPPMNILLLAAIVRENGFVPFIIDCPALNIGYKEVVASLDRIKPDYVGLTAMTPHIMQAGKLAEKIKEKFPSIPVLLGGAHVSAIPEKTLERFNSIDIGFVGEADLSLVETLNTINKNGLLTDIKGIVFREKGKIINTGARKDTIILDDLPLYAWDLLEGFPELYQPPIFATHNKPATPIITSRGCNAHCTFCYSGGHNNMFTHSTEYIIKMYRHLIGHYGIREFMLFDDNFVMYRKNLDATLNAMIDQKLNLSWSCNARVDLVNKDMLSLMARSGCWQISYGIETGNQKIMDSLQKNITKEKVANAIECTRKAGIRTVGYFMVGHFGETEETIKETIGFAKEIGLDDFRCSFFTPLPGSAASKVAYKYGDFDSDDWGSMNLFQPVFVPHGFTKADLLRWQKRMIRKFFFRPKAVYSYVKMIRNHPLLAIKGAWSLANYLIKK